MTSYSGRNIPSSGNPLCDKLTREFRGRCAAVVRTRETSDMMRRVQRGLDPYENAPLPAPRPAAAAHRAAPSHSAADRKPVAAAAERKQPAARHAEIEARRRRSAAAAADRAREKVPEVRLARAPFPIAAVSLLAIFVMMTMVIVFSFAQNFELSREITSLEAEARLVEQTEKALSLKLEERDDIRLIEDIAVNQIGMVKNNLVESRFVSVSGGDRVELAAQPETDEAAEKSGFFSTMLSAIGENLSKWREYID